MINKDKIKAWLYSIRRTEFALDNLKRALEDLETRRASPPTWMKSPEAVMAAGGENVSKQETWVEFLETYEARKSFLEDVISRHTKKIELYYRTLEQLKEDTKWGYIAADIIHKKYWHKVKPDQVIYTKYVFCTKETFYRYHGKALRFFAEVLESEFRNEK